MDESVQAQLMHRRWEDFSREDRARILAQVADSLEIQAQTAGATASQQMQRLAANARAISEALDRGALDRPADLDWNRLPRLAQASRLQEISRWAGREANGPWWDEEQQQHLRGMARDARTTADRLESRERAVMARAVQRPVLLQHWQEYTREEQARILHDLGYSAHPWQKALASPGARQQVRQLQYNAFCAVNRMDRTLRIWDTGPVDWHRLNRGQQARLLTQIAGWAHLEAGNWQGDARKQFQALGRTARAVAGRLQERDRDR